jgi:hypothetical protein
MTATLGRRAAGTAAAGAGTVPDRQLDYTMN